MRIPCPEGWRQVLKVGNVILEDRTVELLGGQECTSAGVCSIATCSYRPPSTTRAEAIPLPSTPRSAASPATESIGPILEKMLLRGLVQFVRIGNYGEKKFRLTRKAKALLDTVLPYELDPDRIAALRAEGKTWDLVAAALGCTPDAARRALAERGSVPSS